MNSDLTEMGAEQISTSINRNAAATENIAEILEQLVLHAADGDTYTGNQALAKILSDALQYVHKTNGQYHINIGDIWGVFGNYRYGMEGGEGTWNGIWQKQDGVHAEAFHTDPYITQILFAGLVRMLAKQDLTKILSPYTGSPDSDTDHTELVLDRKQVSLGRVQSGSLTCGLVVREDGLSSTMLLKMFNTAILEVIEKSIAISSHYNGQPLRVLRSGRDIQDKGFYTELLMNDRAFFQTGVFENGGSTPTPPTPDPTKNYQNSYIRLFMPNGNEILRYGGVRVSSELIDAYEMRSTLGHRWLLVRKGPGSSAAYTWVEIGESVEDLALLAQVIQIGGSNTTQVFLGNSNGNGHVYAKDKMTLYKSLDVADNVKANNIPELELESGAADTVTLKDYAADSNLGGDSQYSAYVQNDSAENAWKFGTNNGEGKGYHQNINLPVNLSEYLDYEVHATVKSNTSKQLGIALCSNVYAPDYAKFVNTTTSYQDLNFGKVQDFQNRQNTLSLAMNTGSSADYFFIRNITLVKPGTPEGNYVLTAQVTMVGGQPHVEYKWVKQ